MNEHREAAERWLNKAVQMEAEGKPTSLINKALDKACEYEHKANHPNNTDMTKAT